MRHFCYRFYCFASVGPNHVSAGFAALAVVVVTAEALIQAAAAVDDVLVGVEKLPRTSPWGA